MITMNFLPWRDKRKRQKRNQYAAMLALSSFMAMGFVTIAHFIASHSNQKQLLRNDFLQVEIRKVNSQLEPLRPFKDNFETLMQRFNGVQALKEEGVKAIKVVNALGQVIPDGIYYKEIKYKEGKIIVKGQAVNSAKISHLMRNIKNSDSLHNADLTEINSDTEGGETFSLEIYSNNNEAQDG